MRREIRWGLVALLALAAGVACAEPYARLAAPYYAAVDRLVATGRPWEITSVDVRPGKSNLTAELQLNANVFRFAGAGQRAARVVGHVQVGEVIETPLVYWTVLLALRVRSKRQLLTRLAVGIPVFLVLEAVTTSTQLILPMAQGPQHCSPARHIRSRHGTGGRVSWRRGGNSYFHSVLRFWWLL